MAARRPKSTEANEHINTRVYYLLRCEMQGRAQHVAALAGAGLPFQQLADGGKVADQRSTCSRNTCIARVTAARRATNDALARQHCRILLCIGVWPLELRASGDASSSSNVSNAESLLDMAATCKAPPSRAE